MAETLNELLERTGGRPWRVHLDDDDDESAFVIPDRAVESFRAPTAPVKSAEQLAAEERATHEAAVRHAMATVSKAPAPPKRTGFAGALRFAGDSPAPAPDAPPSAAAKPKGLAGMFRFRG